MNSNPDREYAQRAATTPVAPATLWFFPQLARLDGSVQRSALSTAWKQAQGHWTSRVLWALWGGLVLAQLWSLLADQPQMLRPLRHATFVLFLFWVVNGYVRVRSHLSARGSGT